MAHCIEQDSLVIDSGRTGGYHRILTETSVEMSPKIVNQKIKLVTEEVTSKIQSERIHTEVIRSKVKSTFVYFKPPTKAIHSVARQKARSQLNIVTKSQSTVPKQGRSREIKEPRLGIFKLRDSQNTGKDCQNRREQFLFTPFKRQPKKYLDLTASKTTAKGIQLSIQATDNESLAKSILTDKSRSKVSRLRIHALGKHLHPLAPQHIIRNT